MPFSLSLVRGRARGVPRVVLAVVVRGRVAGAVHVVLAVAVRGRVAGAAHVVLARVLVSCSCVECVF